MKKIILVALLLSIFLGGCAEKGVTQVKPEVVTQKFDDNETFMVYLGLSYCSACKIFRSIVESVIKTEGIEVLYVEYDKEAENNEANLKTLVETKLQQNETFPYAFPIIFIVQEGKIVDQFSLQQTDNEAEFIARLVNDGVLSKQ